ncbi:hypothetical protein RCO48_14430 [Peribacillus frigoritolerans]|nr:hypothetical protein [Peribacillus frigoritolerans]
MKKALLKKFDRRKGVNQVVSATGKSMSDTKVTIQTYEKKQGEWRRALKKMEGVIGKNGFTKSKKRGMGNPRLEFIPLVRPLEAKRSRPE